MSCETLFINYERVSRIRMQTGKAELGVANKIIGSATRIVRHINSVMKDYQKSV